MVRTFLFKTFNSLHKGNMKQVQLVDDLNINAANNDAHQKDKCNILLS